MRHTLVMEGRNLHICVGNFDFFFIFLSFPCLACTIWCIEVLKGFISCFCCIMLMIRGLFLYLVFVIGRANVTERQAHRAATSKVSTDAGTVRSLAPQCPHQYAFPEHPNSLGSFFSVPPGLLVYRWDCQIPPFRFFAARFRPYGLASMVKHSASRCFGSACSSNLYFLYRFFLLRSSRCWGLFRSHV